METTLKILRSQSPDGLQWLGRRSSLARQVEVSGVRVEVEVSGVQVEVSGVKKRYVFECCYLFATVN